MTLLLIAVWILHIFCAHRSKGSYHRYGYSRICQVHKNEQACNPILVIKQQLQAMKALGIYLFLKWMVTMGSANKS